MWQFSKFVLTGLVLALVGTLCAQTTRGTIAGVVTDAQGLVVPGAAVTAAAVEGGDVRSTTGPNTFRRDCFARRGCLDRQLSGTTSRPRRSPHRCRHRFRKPGPLGTERSDRRLPVQPMRRSRLDSHAYGRC